MKNKKEIQITLPKLGESILEATVVRWFKKKGDAVSLDEPLLEVSTDKVNSEIPSPAAGFLKEILAQPDETLKIGDPLAILSTEESVTVIPNKKDKNPDYFSPAIMQLAKEANLSLEELEKIPPTGFEGRLTKKDVKNYLAVKKEGTSNELLEKVKMSPMRKSIAQNMVRSFYEAPHASLITEVNVTNLKQFIQNNKTSFLQKHKVKLSITSFVAKAIVKALHAYPLINSSLEDDTILMKKYINLGIAVSVEQGVVVPVIRHCQNLTLPEIALRIAELAKKTRSDQLDHEDIKDGTITLTNFGMTGVKIGIPIIRYPEVAIIGLGAIEKKAMVQEDDSIGVGFSMNISLTFDHRVLDGIYGCGFLSELKKNLEQLPEDEL